MNKYIIPTVIVVAVVAVAGVFFVKKNTQTAPTPNGDVNVNGKDVVKNIMNKKALVCEWTSTEDGQIAKGKIYTDGKKRMYSEASVKFDGNDMTMYSLVDGDWAYSWRKGSNEGTKFNIKELDKDEAEQYLPDSGFIDKNDENIDDSLENNPKYKCTAWKVDANLFAVPKNITFKNLSDMMNDLENKQKNLQEKFNGENKNAEAVCDMVPEEYKAECLKNLKGDN